MRSAEDEADTSKYNFPTTDNEIYSKYTGDTNSIMNSLSCPSTEEVPSFGARIPARVLVNHIIALDIPTKHFVKDGDWKNDDGTYVCGFYEHWHREITQMKDINEIPPDTRVYMLDL